MVLGARLRLRDGPVAGGEQSWIAVTRMSATIYGCCGVVGRPRPAPRFVCSSTQPGVDLTLQSMWHKELSQVLPRASSSPAGDRAGRLRHGPTDRGLPNALDELQQAVDLLGDIDDPVAACYVLPLLRGVTHRPAKVDWTAANSGGGRGRRSGWGHILADHDPVLHVVEGIAGNQRGADLRCPVARRPARPRLFRVDAWSSP